MAEKKHKVIFVDIDCTLAHYNGFKGPDVIGEPVEEMVEKVKERMATGDQVVIFSARVAPGGDYQGMLDATLAVVALDAWCKKVFGKSMPITATKQHYADEIWDDRARQVVPNTGMFEDEFRAETGE